MSLFEQKNKLKNKDNNPRSIRTILTQFTFRKFYNNNLGINVDKANYISLVNFLRISEMTSSKSNKNFSVLEYS